MPSPLSPRSIFKRCVHAGALWILVFCAGISEAAPPAAASNVKAFTTRDISGGSSNAFTWWYITWDDNALDEAGYLIRGRYLHLGKPVTPYYNFATEGQDANYTILSFGDQSPDISMQFQVVAFKHNGSKVETRASTNQATASFLSGNSFNAPSALAITKIPGSDGLYDLSWTDNANTEIYHLLSFKKAGDSVWNANDEFDVSLFGDTQVRRALSLTPSTTYHFRVRAQRFGPAPTVTGYSNVIAITTDPLAPPANLTATLLDDITLRLDWADNSTNTMGYELQYRYTHEAEFQPLRDGSNNIIYLGGDDTSYTMTLLPGSDIEWRVRGVFEDSSDWSLHYSEFSNIAAVSTHFPSPTAVAAAATGLAGSIAVKWTFDPGEFDATETTQFRVLGRPADSAEGFSVLATVPASTHETLISGLSIDVPLEVAVVALGAGGGNSLVQEIVEVTPRNGFDPAKYVANLDPADFGMVLLTPLREALVEPDPNLEDNDGDGVPDAHDSHPDDLSLWCDWNGNSINDHEEDPVFDSDGDGVTDDFDSHLDDFNLWCDWDDNGINDNEEMSNPMTDTDGDGVTDDFDSHPNNSNLWCDWNDNGINDNEEDPVTDSDGDGVDDEHDSHPYYSDLWCDWNDNSINDNEEDPEPSTTITVAHEVVRGIPFEHTLAVTDPDGRVAWSVADLPQGFSPFDDSSGQIAGTPSESGVVQSPVTVVYDSGVTAAAKLVFRIQSPPGAPVVKEPLAERTIGIGTPLSIPLSGAFRDPDTPRAARLTTTLGTIDIALNEDITPQTAANFLAYVTNGDYDNVAFHRSFPGFVIQAGGFKPVAEPNQFASVSPRSPSPRNEPGVANTRGTIAAAKLGNDPNSATHDFFINLADNNRATNPLLNLDLQNRGFTVFGRVIGSGMSVADDIAALPRGDYGVIVDGQPAYYYDWPLDAEEPPAAMNINQTVRITSAAEISPLSFDIETNSHPGIVEATVIGAELLITGLADGSADITIRATDLEGNTVTQTLTAQVENGHIHPAITQHPQNQSVPPGTQVVFSVEATGTGLDFQWRKNGVPLPDQTGTSLSLNAVTAADMGDYDVVVSSPTDTLISQSAILTVTQEALITAQLTPRIVQSGQPLVLTLGITGQPVPNVSWFKNGEPLAQTGPVLTIESAALADNGFYKALASNSTGQVESAAVPVVVVDSTPVQRLLKPGSSTTLAVVVAHPPGVELAYQWKNGSGGNVPQGGRFSGVTTSKLSLKGVNLLEGPDTYTCQVTGPGDMGSASSGVFDVIVATKPEVTIPDSLPDAVVGQDYEYFIPVDAAKSRTPASFSATGLPKGLKLDKATGRIHGRPVVAGQFKVKLRASNPSGASPQVTADLRVIPLPSNTTGAFVTLLARQMQINAACGGRVDLNLTDNGTFSGKVTLPSGVHAVRGTTTRSVMFFSGSPATVVGGSATIKRKKNLPPLELQFLVDAATGEIIGELRLDEDNRAELFGWKNFWNKTYLPPANYGYPGAYHFGMTVPEEKAGDLTIPQGAGYAVLTVNDSGLATVKGRTFDNKPLLCSAPLGPIGSFFVFQLLYKKTGSLLGPLAIAQRDADLFGNITHVEITTAPGFSFDHYKRDSQPASTRDYRDGFQPPVPLEVRGGRYTPPQEGGLRNALARLDESGFLDSAFSRPVQTNGPIFALLPQGDKILIGGQFGHYGDKPHRGLARLHADGTLDESFNPGDANGPVYDIALDADGKILVAGAFTQLNGATRHHIARLHADGSLDNSFDPGDGPSATVETVAVQEDGRILIGGVFTGVSGVNRPGLARLTSTGALDNTFNTGTAVNAAVRRIVVQPDQKILIGGDFTLFSGATRNRIARLNPNGSLDTTFAPGSGASSTVRAITVLADDKILIGGNFATYNGVSRNAVARLHSNGTLDTGLNPGTGANDEIRALAVRPDGKILIGGVFSLFNNAARSGVALLAANGALDTSFAPAADAANNVRALLSLDDNQVLIGGWVVAAEHTTRILGLTDSSDQARLVFSHARVEESATIPDATFIVNAANKGTPSGPNPGATTWKFNAKTGILSGRAILRDGAAKRTANYTALIVPVTPSNYRGFGSFDLPELPDGIITTSKNSPIHTGRIDVRPAP